jgi:hypothetical protein
MADEWDERAKAWAQGMRLAAPHIRTRQIAAQPMAVANRAKGAKTLCGIAGCKRHAYKGRVCRKHYALVPHELRMGAWIAGVTAEMRAVERHRRRYLPAVRELLAEADSKAS